MFESHGPMGDRGYSEAHRPATKQSAPADSL